MSLEDDVKDPIEPENSQPTMSFDEKFAQWQKEAAERDVIRAKNPRDERLNHEFIRIKDVKANAYPLDQLFWNHPDHHKSLEFYTRVLGFIKKAIGRYGIEEQQTDEDLPLQIYNKICDAIESYFDPYKANVVTFLHKVLFNHVKLRAYHINKYKDGSFYNRYYTYDNIIKSITKCASTTDLIALDNYFDHLKHLEVGIDAREFLKKDLVKIAPKNNIFFKTVVWELLQSSEEMTIGKLRNRNTFNARSDFDSVQERRRQIRRS